MPTIESLSSLLENIYQKACYIATNSTGFNRNDISNVLFDESGNITVRFKWYYSGDTDIEDIELLEEDFNDIDIASARVKQVRENKIIQEQQREQEETERRKQNIIDQEKKTYLELKKKYEG